MPYNLRPKKHKNSREKVQKPPPDSSDDSSDEDVVISMTFISPDENPRKTKKQSNKKKPKKGELTKVNKPTKKGSVRESPLEVVLKRLEKVYGGSEENESEEIDSDSDDDYDPRKDDEYEDDGFVVSDGMMTLGDFMGGMNKNPYDIRLPPKKLTPELLEYLQNMPNILGKAPKPGEDIDAFRELPKERQKLIIKSVKQITNVVDSEEHPYFRIFSLPIDANSKRTALERQIAVMNSENSQMGNTDQKTQAWIRGFLSIPFGKYRKPNARANKDSSGYLRWSMEVMNKIAFGMDDAKDHILRYVAQMITNPQAAGNCMAFLGPPGTGKTSLISNGLGKILNRPVHMIALGGNTDASVLEGHSYTYEGSVWGQIVDILIRSKCMNPVIIFDELDKVSGTSKGDEIIGLLTHITDSTQNKSFQDKYFSGINIDLSRVLFVFTMNNRESVNPILMDRLRVIHTKGYSLKEKRIIGEQYLLPRLLKNYAIPNLKMSDSAWKWILNERREDGVRNLKRDLETIVSRLNLLQLFKPSGSSSSSSSSKQVVQAGNKIVSSSSSSSGSSGSSSHPVVKSGSQSNKTVSSSSSSSGSSGSSSHPVNASSTVLNAIKTASNTPTSSSNKLVDNLPKGVPRGIKWVPGEILGDHDVRILLEGRNVKHSNIPVGMYC
jgi:DNA replication protein DnaC